MSDPPPPRIEIIPFHDPQELRQVLVHNLDQLPGTLQVLEPDFEVCGAGQRGVLTADAEGRLCLLLPYAAGQPVRVEEVPVAARTLENFLPWLRRMFPGAAFEASLPPRLMLVAEEIPAEVVALTGRLVEGCTCFRYIPLRVGKQRALLLRPVGGAGEDWSTPAFRDGTAPAWDALSDEEARVLLG
jgi:hypothetical protein